MNESNPFDALTPEELAALVETLEPQPEEEEGLYSSEGGADQEPLVLRFDLLAAAGTLRHGFPALDLAHEQLGRELVAAFERATHREGFVATRPPEVVPFSELHSTLGTPCGALVVELEGLGARGMLVVDPSLLLHWVDLLMGGPGGESDLVHMLPTRGFTASERRLIGHVVTLVGQALSAAWADLLPISLRLVRAEVDARHALLFEAADPVIDMALDVEWSGVGGQVRLVMPLVAVRPFEKVLARRGPACGNTWSWSEDLNALCRDIPVEVTALLGRASVTLRQLLTLRTGELLRLDGDPESPLDLLVEGIPKYQATPTVHRGNLAVQLLAHLPEASEQGEAT